MGAYENAMHEEGTCKDFAGEIIRIVDKMLHQENRPTLRDLFFACRKIELEYLQNRPDEHPTDLA